MTLRKISTKMDFIKKYRISIVFTVVGLLGGFLYWKYIGCLTGSCPIKSVWYLSTLFGGLIGYLTGSIVNDMIIKFRKKKNPGID